ncbi:K(+)-transporting ATPase subunit B [bacterium]|nr:K(+)-transporting ATPase subunit B [bacterium]
MTKRSSIFNRALVLRALADMFAKLSPRQQARNLVMFIVYLGAIVTTVLLIAELFRGRYSGFNLQIGLWLWFTVLFANFAEAMAEGRGKAQADSLRRTRTTTHARLLRDGRETTVNAADLNVGDTVVCETGDIIPGDGEVIEGIASVDESAITGESAPVIRESGGDRSAVTGGTKVLSDRIVVRITSRPGETFLDKMISLVEGAKRQPTPNEIALSVMLVALTVVFCLAVVTLYPMALYSFSAAGQGRPDSLSVSVLIALLVCLIPTTIGGLLSAIGISGMDRMLQHNVLAMSGRAVEAAGDIDVLLLDKTGTITLGNRMATEFVPAPGVSPERLAEAAQLASLSDETPEGRSVVVLAKEKYGLRARSVSEGGYHFIPFTAQSKMSGVDYHPKGGKAVSIRKGSADAVEKYVHGKGGEFPKAVHSIVADISGLGGTPLVVVENTTVLGVIHLKDIVKGGLQERFENLRRMGITSIMITGDNHLTAASIAAEANVDDFLAQATPETKLKALRYEQSLGHLVAMIGDGTNDAPALAQADVGVAMNTGTQAAREAGNMIDLDSNPTKLLEIVEIGKQILMTRGALTTFSIANDVSKYFAIIPAIFGSLYAASGGTGPLAAFNIMRLQSPQSAVLSSIIFNALIIVALIPLALKGVKYRPIGADGLLKRNLLVYGLGGLLVPFVGIKLIDLILNLLHLV